MLMTWDQKYSVSVGKIDDQHIKLFELINDLHEAMQKGKAKETLSQILLGVLDYTKMHFGVEEVMMNRANYPDYSHHKAIHEMFVEEIIKTKKELDEGKLVTSMDVMNKLKNWLTGHIMKEDQSYTPYLSKFYH
jgi:hemerythrin